MFGYGSGVPKPQHLNAGLGTWSRRLARRLLKKNKREMSRAAAHAQKIGDMVLDFHPQFTPSAA